jgi:hypothetical protein
MPKKKSIRKKRRDFSERALAVVERMTGGKLKRKRRKT